MAQHRIRGRRRGWLMSLAAATLALATTVPSAFAQTGLRERYAVDWGFSHEECGWTFDVTGQTSGTFHARIGKGDFESAFFFHDNYEFVETHVRSDGATITMRGNGLIQDGRAVLIEGTTYAFSWVTAGQRVQIYNGEGELLASDRGSIKLTVMLDTEGDDVPGGQFVGLVALKINGLAPTETADYCSWFEM